MKKYTLLILLLCMFTLIACQKRIDEASVQIGSQIISLEDDMDDALKKLGNFKLHKQMKSCLYPGYDHEYTFDDVILSTYPKNGKQKIKAIRVISENVHMHKSLKIHDKEANIKKAYTIQPSVSSSFLITYKNHKVGTSFYLKNGVIEEYELYSLDE